MQLSKLMRSSKNNRNKNKEVEIDPYTNFKIENRMKIIKSTLS